MSEEQVTIMNGDEAAVVSLADLGGLDLTNVEEFRGGGTTPGGVYEMRIKETELGSMRINDKDSVEEDGKTERAMISFTVESLACLSLKDKALDPTAMAGLEHRESFFIRDLAKDIGRVKAFLSDVGLQASGSLSDILDASVGMEFVCGIKNTTDKNDKDRVYANIDMKTIKPLQGAAPPLAAVGATAPVQQAAPAPAVGGISL